MHQRLPVYSSDDQRIVSLCEKDIRNMQIIKTLNDTVFGKVRLGKFNFEGSSETSYAYVLKLSDRKPISQQALWQMIESSKLQPEKGYFPQLLAYSTKTDSSAGFLDLLQRVDGEQRADERGNLSEFNIHELYFEPFPENLKLQLLKRAKDKRPFRESELRSFVACLCKALADLKNRGLPYPGLCLETVIPVGRSYMLYHPFLVAQSASNFSKILRGAKHFAAPEEVKAAKACANEEAYSRQMPDMGRCVVFSLALILLEMITLIEDEYYDEQGCIMNDRVRIKLHMVEEDFPGLAPMLYDMLAADRPSVDRLATIFKLDAVDRHPSYLSLLANQPPSPPPQAAPQPPALPAPRQAAPPQPARYNFMADESQDSCLTRRRVVAIRRYEIRNGEKVLVGEEFPDGPSSAAKPGNSEVTAACEDIKAKIDMLIRMNGHN